MSFAGSVADHQQPHCQETRKTPPDFIHCFAQRRNSFDEILLHEENRLNAAYFSGAIFEHQIMMLEIVSERVRHDLVEPMVLCFAFKGACPEIVSLEVRPRQNTRHSTRERN